MIVMSEFMALWYISHPMILSSVNCGLKTYCDIAWFCVFQIICSTENHVRIQEGKQIKINKTVPDLVNC